MTSSEFVKLLQNELIVQRDPHLSDRLIALLDEHFEPIAAKEPTPADGVSTDLAPQEPSVADPTSEPFPSESSTAPAPSSPEQPEISVGSSLEPATESQVQ